MILGKQPYKMTLYSYSGIWVGRTAPSFSCGIGTVIKKTKNKQAVIQSVYFLLSFFFSRKLLP